MTPDFPTPTRKSRAPAWRSWLAVAGFAVASFSSPSAAPADCVNSADHGCETRDENASSSTATLQTPLAALQSYLRKRAIDANTLTLVEMVDVMLDWYRIEPMAAQGDDQLVFRYGGWSEGCATAFKFSVLRRITEGGDSGERLAGITIMFEPSGKDEWPAFSTQSGELGSLEAFAAAVKSSKAYQQLAGVTPLGVVVEAGGLR